MDIDWLLEFRCSVCGPSPDLVVCDATSLSYRQKYWTAPQEMGASQPRLPGSSHNSHSLRTLSCAHCWVVSQAQAVPRMKESWTVCLWSCLHSHHHSMRCWSMVRQYSRCYLFWNIWPAQHLSVHCWTAGFLMQELLWTKLLQEMIPSLQKNSQYFIAQCLGWRKTLTQRTLHVL